MCKIKNFVKSVLCVMIAFVSAYLYPIVGTADFVYTNANYLGIYNNIYHNIYNQASYINISSSGVSAVIVFAPDEGKYISAFGGTGYININSFYADFDRYYIKNPNGTTVGYINSPLILQGDVTYHSPSNIDIDIGSYTYNKELKRRYVWLK